MQDIYWPVWVYEGKPNKEVEKCSLMIGVTDYYLVQCREAERMNCTEMKNLPSNLTLVNGHKTVHQICGLLTKDRNN